jgi:hypothetical protein
MLLPAPSIAQGQRVQPSENDIFALYCFGVLKFYTDGFDQGYSNACPTGQERGCDVLRAGIAKRREGLNRVTRYISARGYRSGAQTGIQQQLIFSIRSGESDAQKCAAEGWDNIFRPPKFAGMPADVGIRRPRRCWNCDTIQHRRPGMLPTSRGRTSVYPQKGNGGRSRRSMAMLPSLRP